MPDAFPTYVVIWVFVVAWGTLFAILALWAFKNWRKQGFKISLKGILVAVAVLILIVLLEMFTD